MQIQESLRQCRDCFFWKPIKGDKKIGWCNRGIEEEMIIQKNSTENGLMFSEDYGCNLYLNAEKQAHMKLDIGINEDSFLHAEDGA